jgi:hypothetical protein
LALAAGIYERFESLFSGARWAKLAAEAARVLRPKWTRIAPLGANQALTDYANALGAPDTVITFTLESMEAFLRDGHVGDALLQSRDNLLAYLNRLEVLGIDLEEIGHTLQRQHLAASDDRYQSLIRRVSQKRFQLEEEEWRRGARR